MKITSSYMNEFNLTQGKVHAIIFKNTKYQMKFKHKINQYFTNKQEEEKFVNIVNTNYQKEDAKKYYFLNLNFSAVYTATEKSTDKIIRETLAYHLNHNPYLISLYQNIEKSIDEFLTNIEIQYEDVNLEFEITDKVIDNMLKAIKIHIDYNKEALISNNEIRKLLISSLLDLNMTEKEVFILINHPEGEIAKDMFYNFVNYLKELNVTVIILTSAVEFVEWTDSDKLYLINENGLIYDIMKLKQELLEFKYVNQENATVISNKLAYHDFMEDYLLLDPKYHYFLRSSKI